MWAEVSLVALRNAYSGFLACSPFFSRVLEHHVERLRDLDEIYLWFFNVTPWLRHCSTGHWLGSHRKAQDQAQQTQTPMALVVKDGILQRIVSLKYHLYWISPSQLKYCTGHTSSQIYYA